jgi:endonuclease/exonuclease/phosphatase (EEP) superfamily protein YafD
MREVFPWQQAAQARQVLADASARPGPAIIAGDLNRRGLGRIFEANGWHWATREVGRTHHVWSFDHVFLRGMAGPCRAGAVPAGLSASDHQAVWASVGCGP